MLVRWRPTVFVSSAIDGLEDLRERVYEEIRALHLADAWLFEFHAVAAGSPPEDQYLAAARSCDVFVLLVGDEARPGTIAEYEVAVADNPAKVLPFVYGAATASSAELRARLRDSHAYKRLRSLEELSGVVAGAVGAYLETGSIARPGLLTRLEERRATGRVFLGLPAGFGFERELSWGGSSPCPSLARLCGRVEGSSAGHPATLWPPTLPLHWPAVAGIVDDTRSGGRAYRANGRSTATYRPPGGERPTTSDGARSRRGPGLGEAGAGLGCIERTNGGGAREITGLGVNRRRSPGVHGHDDALRQCHQRPSHLLAAR